MAKAGSYYYDLLNKEQQKAYYAMKEGLVNLKDSFAVPMLSQKELSDIYFLIRMDCPEIFYSVTFTYKYYPDSSAVEMTPKYLFPKDKIREHRQAMEARVKKLANQAAGLDEKEKQLLCLRYFENKTQCEVAVALGMSQVQISRLERKILLRLREQFM